MVNRIVTLISILVALISLSLWAFGEPHGHGASHNTAHAPEGGMPLEGGQAAFSALIEMIALLEADQDTDWSSVTIDALHLHLQDMNRLVLQTQAKTSTASDGSVEFNAVAQGAALEALHRMVPMHADLIARSRNLQIATAPHSQGVRVKISDLNQQQSQKLSALGFYGFMSLDAHHQAHHYQMATGGAMH
ncbi:MAG: hypothetical protein AAF404_09790 [Pseudomonadota bacterium]